MPWLLKQQLENARKDAQMEALFHAFGGMSMRVKSLAGIVQNPGNPGVAPGDIREWLDEVQDVQNTFDALIKQTTAFLIAGSL